MFGLGAGEILIILVIAFLLFGPKQLPKSGVRWARPSRDSKRRQTT
ncbi:MAG: twin-arginine translocase TatA/TatE family subunit [Nitrospira sp.]